MDLAADRYQTMAPLLTFEDRSFVWGMMEVAVEAAEARAMLDAEDVPAATAP